MKKTTLYLCFLSSCLYLAACTPNDQIADQCPTCPNNTECQAGDCGCPPDKHDMGSWCLQKSDNLFVAASLDCYCIDVVGLYLFNIQPETEPLDPGGHFPKSGYWLAGRGNSQGSGISNFDYFALPDGDSIAIYGISMPNSIGLSNCQINKDLRCQADIFGKFEGPDTIQTQVVWRRCNDSNGNGLNYSESKALTFVRKL